MKTYYSFFDSLNLLHCVSILFIISSLYFIITQIINIYKYINNISSNLNSKYSYLNLIFILFIYMLSQIHVLMYLIINLLNKLNIINIVNLNLLSLSITILSLNISFFILYFLINLNYNKIYLYVRNYRSIRTNYKILITDLTYINKYTLNFICKPIIFNFIPIFVIIFSNVIYKYFL